MAIDLRLPPPTGAGGSGIIPTPPPVGDADGPPSSNRPGSLGGLARTLGENGVNIELAYTTFGGVKLVVATDDLDSARAALA